MNEKQERIALVTGASRGIGYHAALALAKEGFHLIAVARTVGGLEELDDEIQANGGSATLVPLDLLDHDAIDRLGASIFERWGKLDVLIANAGILGGLSPLEHIDPKTFEKVHKLNVTSNWRLMRSLSVLLRASENGRAVFMTSNPDDMRKPFWGAYSSSQAALQSMVKTWAAECEKLPLRINLLDTGPMRTALRAEAMPGENPDDIAHPSEIGPSVMALTFSTLQDNGKLYCHKSGSFR
ncbi:MAG: SDR family NAD(P)-dependent oxidoreductase [Pseudomonadota bacterium]